MSHEPAPTETVSGEEAVRLEKLKALSEAGQEAYAYEFEKLQHLSDVIQTYGHLKPQESEDQPLTVAGRLMAKRGHGKAIFGNIQDVSGSLQFYANIDQLGEAVFSQLTTFDTGDILGIEGTPFCTKRGELSIKATKLTLLTKSLTPLPEKFHGLQDKEIQYRRRYLDLISNTEVKERFKTRSKIFSMVRRFLEDQDFMEVETPVLQHIYGGAAAKPFETFHNELAQNLFLRIALELPLKRLIVGGYERVFEMGRVFRNEGISYKHNPEYTLLELYQAYADYTDIMALTEDLIRHVVTAIHGTTTIDYQGESIDFGKPFKRVTLSDIVQTHASVDVQDEAALKAKARDLQLELPESATKGHLISEIYDKVCEPKLIQPTFVMDYPIETSPLAKKKRDNPNLVERFELIVSGMELANAFTELNDPIDQKERFEDQVKAKKAGWDEAHMMDEDFIQALKVGMPPTGGLGIGMDRLVMILTNQHAIRDVLFFPHMKPKTVVQ